jgi:hypothetical protein
MEEFLCYGGKVRGQNLHTECMTEEESRVTWGTFYGRHNPPDLDMQCDRCGEFLLDPPGEPPASLQ